MPERPTHLLRAPYPYFGGKSIVAPEIWARFGTDLDNYVEPCFGSGATLFACPTGGVKYETVGDKCHHVANFWRSVQHDPDGVADWASYPVSEVDLHARHAWLIKTSDTRRIQIEQDPDFYDVKAAGWWAWGMCLWLGTGWCSERAILRGGRQKGDVPAVTSKDIGLATIRQTPVTHNQGIFTARRRFQEKAGGVVAARRNANDLQQWMRALSDRLQNVRVLCGDWKRCVTPAVTWKLGKTGILLDPPYGHHTGRDNTVYACDQDIAAEVAAWCIKNGDNPLLRIAFCGYEGEHKMPPTWSCYPWKSRGGFSGISSKEHTPGKDNRLRERIWFSPHCLPPTEKQPQRRLAI